MQYGAAQSALPRASTAVYLDQGGAGLVASVCGVVVVVVVVGSWELCWPESRFTTSPPNKLNTARRLVHLATPL